MHFKFKYLDISSRTAILLFTRKAQLEASYKCFHGGVDKQGNIEIAHHLINSTINTCLDSELPYFVIDQTKQHGSHFGDRLSHAFESVFKLGYDSVIAVGNDCPDLNNADLKTAEKSLKNGNDVLGPAKDGGVYLIGLTKESFEDGILDDIQWRSNRVFKELLSVLQTQVELLSQKFDIDSHVGRRLAGLIGTAFHGLWKLITQYLQPRSWSYSKVSIHLDYQFEANRRGPPIP